MYMALLHPDSRQRGPLRALLAAGALLCLLPAQGAGLSDETVHVDGKGLTIDLNAGTKSMTDLKLRQGSTLIEAKQANGSDLANGHRNGTWKLSGGVHIEFDGALLDAETATVKFMDNKVKTIAVQGAPANFSHTLRNSGQRIQGRSVRIDYDTGTGEVQFNGGTAFKDGTSEFKTEAELTYNLQNGIVRTPQGSRSEGSYQPPDKRESPPDMQVPPPRTPDRATAQ